VTIPATSFVSIPTGFVADAPAIDASAVAARALSPLLFRVTTAESADALVLFDGRQYRSDKLSCSTLELWKNKKAPLGRVLWNNSLFVRTGTVPVPRTDFVQI